MASLLLKHHSSYKYIEVFVLSVLVMFYPHRVTLFTEVCIMKQQIYENVIDVFFPQICTLEVFVIALKPAIILQQYYMCYREGKGKKKAS